MDLGKDQQDAFNSLNMDLASPETVALYSPERETVISADSSSYGLGAVFLQRQENGKLQPVAYSILSLTEIEQRYAQIEKVALSITWSLEHWSDLLVGLFFRAETDHKPLVPLFIKADRRTSSPDSAIQKATDEVLLCHRPRTW